MPNRAEQRNQMAVLRSEFAQAMIRMSQIAISSQIVSYLGAEKVGFNFTRSVLSQTSRADEEQKSTTRTSIRGSMTGKATSPSAVQSQNIAKQTIAEEDEDSDFKSSNSSGEEAKEDDNSDFKSDMESFVRDEIEGSLVMRSTDMDEASMGMNRSLNQEPVNHNSKQLIRDRQMLKEVVPPFIIQ